MGSETEKSWVKKDIGKHCLCATIRFLIDLGGVLLVTWVIRTPYILNSAKSPCVVYVSNFILLVHPFLIDFGEEVLLLLVTGVKQSQLLVLRFSLEFDKKYVFQRNFEF